MTPTSLPLAPHAAPLRIGVFDSGLGGLSVLRAIRALLPAAQLLYVADSGHAPYGERGEAFVVARSLRIAGFLRTQGAQLLVVACNTATAAAAAALRGRYADWPIVGVEPGVKPAAALTRNGRVGVLATEGTLRSERFRLLAQAHAAHVELHLQPCPGLAAAIEGGALDAPTVQAAVERCCAPVRDFGADTVVLGCTHYPFVAEAIQRALGPAVTLIDTADAVARRTADLAAQLGASVGASVGGSVGGSAIEPVDAPAAQLWSSGDAALLGDVAHRWLRFETVAQPLPAEVCATG